MKLFSLLAFYFVLTTHGYSKCNESSMSFWPGGSTICQNSIFMVEGYGGSQSVVTGLNKKYPIYLRCGTKRIKLLVKQICIGEFSVTQAILSPEERLTVGKEYEIGIDSLGEQQSSVLPWNRDTLNPRPAHWIVKMGSDSQRPVWTSPPQLLRKIHVSFGCGPMEFVVFSCPAKDSSLILVKATVTNLSSGKRTTYYIEARKDEQGRDAAEVGHGMCSGPFGFKEKGKYVVEFSLMDFCGNCTGAIGKPMKFSRPTRETSLW